MLQTNSKHAVGSLFPGVQRTNVIRDFVLVHFLCVCSSVLHGSAHHLLWQMFPGDVTGPCALPLLLSVLAYRRGQGGCRAARGAILAHFLGAACMRAGSWRLEEEPPDGTMDFAISLFSGIRCCLVHLRKLFLGGHILRVVTSSWGHNPLVPVCHRP